MCSRREITEHPDQRARQSKAPTQRRLGRGSHQPQPSMVAHRGNCVSGHRTIRACLAHALSPAATRRRCARRTPRCRIVTPQSRHEAWAWRIPHRRRASNAVISECSVWAAVGHQRRRRHGDFACRYRAVSSLRSMLRSSRIGTALRAHGNAPSTVKTPGQFDSAQSCRSARPTRHGRSAGARSEVAAIRETCPARVPPFRPAIHSVIAGGATRTPPWPSTTDRD